MMKLFTKLYFTTNLKLQTTYTLLQKLIFEATYTLQAFYQTPCGHRGGRSGRGLCGAGDRHAGERWHGGALGTGRGSRGGTQASGGALGRGGRGGGNGGA